MTKAVSKTILTEYFWAMAVSPGLVKINWWDRPAARRVLFAASCVTARPAILYGAAGRAITSNCTAGNACPRIVAAADIFNIPATQYCTLHNNQQMGDVISINVQINPTGPRCVAMGHMVYWRYKTDPH